MVFLHGSSKLTKKELLRLAEESGTLLLNPKKINSEEEILLAERLAIDSFGEKRNLAKRRETEFLLWLSARGDIASAFRSYSFQSPKDILLISFTKTKPQLKKLFWLQEKPLKVKKKATSLEIEKISLSRIL